MAEEHTIVDIMKAFTQALVDKDTDKAISFLTEDAVWISPNGKFSNIAEIRKYIEWMNNNIADQYITGIGLDVLVKANVGIYEQRIGGISRGRKWNASALCIYEFRDKIADNAEKPRVAALRALVASPSSLQMRIPPSPQVSVLEAWKLKLAKSPIEPTTRPL